MAAIIGVNLRGEKLGMISSPVKSTLVKYVSLVLLFSLSTGLFLWAFRAARVHEFGLGINHSRYPYAAVQRLKEMEFSGNIYNSWRFGGFLQWELPEAKTFIDGRCIPEQLQLYDRFLEIDLHQFAHYMSVNNVQAALLNRRNEWID